jgi:hypothetical protein
LDDTNTKRRKAMDTARRANDVLMDPVLVEAFNELEARYTSEWKTSKVDEGIKRERAYIAVQMLDDLKTQLQIYVDQGRVAERQLQKDSLM